ncbi:PhzF family phenazine biosynthesis protein [Nocardia paucivorans]|uniref:PhzF family phenazine biosynthesis protein n=1 Tax=Nocardia paucivorans TaxID=114259 RepID=UPI0002EA2B4A|nr:PhzF family phenazine biosynthesis protein [Nocardia paucivorans]
MGTQAEVLRVFTDATGRFGNELGVVRAEEVATPDRQAVATRLGFSETIFVDDPVDGVARVRIYTPAVELPFAGHPAVGTAWWLAQRGTPAQILDLPAGLVRVQSTHGLVSINVQASWTTDFTFHQVANTEELAAFTPTDFDGGEHYVWTWTDEHRGALRSRMFAPAVGVAEDEATGAAAVALTARLRQGLVITQGKGSQIFTEWNSDGWVCLAGRVVAEPPVTV